MTSLRRPTIFVRRFAPASFQRYWFQNLARSFAHRLERTSSLEKRVAIATGKEVFRSNQRPAEIFPFLSRLGRMRPKVLCEIGCDTGGTLALLASCAAPDAMLISLDLNASQERFVACEQFATKRQQIVTLAGNSHDPRIFDRVQAALNGRSMDVLFIDGDHTLEGVGRDFCMYAPLLRQGGLLAFHDIVDDKYVTGQVPSTYAGGVPEFFRDYLSPHFPTESLIEDLQQSGYGIGLVNWPDPQTALESVSKIAQQLSTRNSLRQKVA